MFQYGSLFLSDWCVLPSTRSLRADGIIKNIAFLRSLSALQSGTAKTTKSKKTRALNGLHASESFLNSGQCSIDLNLSDASHRLASIQMYYYILGGEATFRFEKSLSGLQVMRHPLARSVRRWVLHHHC